MKQVRRYQMSFEGGAAVMPACLDSDVAALESKLQALIEAAEKAVNPLADEYWKEAEELEVAIAKAKGEPDA